MSDLDLPFAAVQEQVNNAIDLVIQLDRGADGSRRVTEVALLTSKGREPYHLHTICEFDYEAGTPDRVVRGQHITHALPLVFTRRLRMAGESVPESGPVDGV